MAPSAFTDILSGKTQKEIASKLTTTNKNNGTKETNNKTVKNNMNQTNRKKENIPGPTTRKTGEIAGSTEDVDLKKVAQDAAIFVCCCAAARLIFEVAYSALSILALPLIYFYSMQNCPTNESFDAKKELKHVLRGDHLADDNPDKPKGFFGKVIADARAGIATTAATLPGYEVLLMDVISAFKIARVRVPTTKLDFYWIGIFGHWRYLMSKDIPYEELKDY